MCMRQLPKGTVTFVFTDIEGSTRLLHTLGDRYRDALKQHRTILRDAFTSHGGVEVDTQGDASSSPSVPPRGTAKPRSEDNAPSPNIPDREASCASAWASTPALRSHRGGYVGSNVHLGARICATAFT